MHRFRFSEKFGKRKASARCRFATATVHSVSSRAPMPAQQPTAATDNSLASRLAQQRLDSARGREERRRTSDRGLLLDCGPASAGLRIDLAVINGHHEGSSERRRLPATTLARGLVRPRRSSTKPAMNLPKAHEQREPEVPYFALSRRNSRTS